MTTSLLERYVLAKPYFDPAGMILAFDQGEVVGLVHAGFGASDDGSELNRELGTICTLVLSPDHDSNSIAQELIRRAEAYLRENNAKVLYGGGVHPLNPFYLGLYGGSELPGVLSGDHTMLDALRASNYEVIDQVVILQRELSTFRPKVDRKTLQVRRKFHIEATFDPPAQNWWEACSFGLTDRTRFILRGKSHDAPCSVVTFWDMEPLASSWGVQVVGMIDLFTAEEFRRQGLATFLIGEALKQLQGYGVTRCQVQTMQHNSAALGLYDKLGFAEVDTGYVLRKSA